MRVLQVTPYYYPELQFGGPPQKIHALSRGLARLGWDVMVFTFHSAGRHKKDQVVYDQIAVQYLPWLGKGHWQTPRHLQTLQTAIDEADLIHCYGLYNLLGPLAVWLGRRKDVPIVLEPLGMFTPRTRHIAIKQVYHYLFTNWMFQYAGRIIATSPTELEELKKAVPEQKLVLRLNGLNLEEYAQLPSPAGFRQQFGLSENERIILYIGRISPIKNLESLITAFAQINIPNTRLILVGPLLEPHYAKSLQTQITTHQLTQRVLLTGPLYGQDKLTALAAAELFVLPSLFESYGNAASEAIAAGLPVLVTKNCGLAPLIDGKAGLAVEATSQGLADGLNRLLQNPANFTQLRAELLPQLSWETPLQQMVQIYQALIKATPLRQ